MSEPELLLFDQAFRVTLLLALPIILTVGGVGIAMGLLQTVVQIQDQNASFAPKVVALALLTATAGTTALAALQALLHTVTQMLPALGRG